MLRILSIVALLCLTTYTYGRVERTLSGDSTARDLTMVSDSATEDVRVGRTLSTLKKCPKVVAKFMARKKNAFGNTRCEASDTVSLSSCEYKVGVMYRGRKPGEVFLSPTRKTNDWLICCWACRIWEKCGQWDWIRYSPDSKGRCRLYTISTSYEEEAVNSNIYAGFKRDS